MGVIGEASRSHDRVKTVRCCTHSSGGLKIGHVYSWPSAVLGELPITINHFGAAQCLFPLWGLFDATQGQAAVASHHMVWGGSKPHTARPLGGSRRHGCVGGACRGLSAGVYRCAGVGVCRWGVEGCVGRGV